MSPDTIASLPVKPRAVMRNPSDEELRKMISAMPNARLTEFDNYNVATRVVARSKGSTYLITDDPAAHSDQTITREEGERMRRLQDK